VAKREARPVSRSTTLKSGREPASKCSTLIDRSKRSADAALVGFGGLVGEASRPRGLPVSYELLSLSRRAEFSREQACAFPLAQVRRFDCRAGGFLDASD